jgi:hypothetical protein
VPADQVIHIIATALRVEPDFFSEYRLRQVLAVLSAAPVLADTLYAVLVDGLPLPADDVSALIGLAVDGPSRGLGPQGVAV